MALTHMNSSIVLSLKCLDVSSDQPALRAVSRMCPDPLRIPQPPNETIALNDSVRGPESLLVEPLETGPFACRCR